MSFIYPPSCHHSINLYCGTATWRSYVPWHISHASLKLITVIYFLWVSRSIYLRAMDHFCLFSSQLPKFFPPLMCSVALVIVNCACRYHLLIWYDSWLWHGIVPPRQSNLCQNYRLNSVCALSYGHFPSFCFWVIGYWRNFVTQLKNFLLAPMREPYFVAYVL